VDSRTREVIENVAFCAEGSALDHLFRVTSDEIESGCVSGGLRNRTGGIEALGCGWIEGFFASRYHKGGDEAFSICQLRWRSGSITNRNRGDLEPSRSQCERGGRPAIGPSAAQRYAHAQSQRTRFLVGKGQIVEKLRRQIRKVDNSFCRVVEHERVDRLNFDAAHAGTLYGFEFLRQFRLDDRRTKPPPAHHGLGIIG